VTLEVDVMGSRGPVPKHSTQRRRRNATEVPIESVTVPDQDVQQPEADPSWHPIAADWYRSLSESGQAVFYQPSDWQTARYVAEAMSRNLSAGRFSAQLFAAVMSATSNLLTTEGDRRRLRIELERGATTDADEDAAVTALNEWRNRLSG
jgi:hypothetical protein